jgi:hypothetical protein
MSKATGRRAKSATAVVTGVMLISAQRSIGDEKALGDWHFVVQMNTAAGVYRTEGGFADLPIAVDVLIGERSRAGQQAKEWENAWRDKFNALWEFYRMYASPVDLTPVDHAAEDAEERAGVAAYPYEHAYEYLVDGGEEGESDKGMRGLEASSQD